MKRLKKTVVCFALLVAACMIFAYPTKIKADKTDTIAEGVYIGSIHVGGMTAEEAAAAIHDYVAAAEKAIITLSAGEQSVQVTGEQLGLYIRDLNVVQEAMDMGKVGSLIKRYKDKKDLEQGSKQIPLTLQVDNATVTALLEEESVHLNQAAVNNGLERENGEFLFVEGAQGIAVSIPDSVHIITEAMGEDWDGTDSRIELAAKIVEPQGSREELSKVRDILGTYTTNYKDSTQNRCTNISIAAELIDGTVLYPGEEFSVAAAIGPLDASKGYELAGAYENGQTVQSYGGGVCQVSSTLYNAVILAELEITERFNHSMIVTYVEPSMDAAIAGDYKDLKFVNNRETPIYLEGYTKGKNVYFNIYGEETRAEDRKVTYESEVVSQDDPPIRFVATADPVGHISVAQSKHVGYVARLWKVVTVDGVEESRDIYNKSTYKSSPKIVNVGTTSEDPNVSAAINEAIATQDEATIYAAVSPYAPNASAIINPAPPAVTPEEQAITGTVDESQITNGVE